MKKIIAVAIILYSFSARSQGDAAIVAAVSLGHHVENQNLKKIVSNEAEIAGLQAIIAQETFVIKELEQKLFNSLSTVQSIIANANQIIEITKMGEDITSYQSQIAQIASQSPELIIIAYEYEALIVQKSASLLTEIFIATVGGETNLMSNKERLDLLYRILEDMTELRNLSFLLLKQMRVATWVDVLETADEQTFDWGVNYEELHRQALDNIRRTSETLGL